MTLERAIRLTRQWMNGRVCSLRAGERDEWYELCLIALLEKQEREQNNEINNEDEYYES